MTVCGAKKKNGTPCQMSAMPNGRCRLHGGLSLNGMQAPAFKTGRHSKYLPARLQERYQQAIADSALLELRDEIGLVDSRLTDLITRIESGESGEVWKLLRSAFDAFSKARAGSKVPEMTEHLATIEHLIVRGLADYAAWQDIHGTLEQRRKLVESERKRLVEMQQMITTEQAMVMLAAITDTVRRHVTDRGALAAISADITKLITIEAR